MVFDTNATYSKKMPKSMLEVDFCKIKLINPTVLASGILGTSPKLMQRVFDSGAGAITMKSIGPEERAGHKNPRILVWEKGMINAVGLPSPGYKNMEEQWAELEKRKFPLIASIYGCSIEDYAEIAGYVASKKPDMIELNMSCPHSKGKGSAFGTEPGIAYEVVNTVRKEVRGIPIIPKLTPNTHLFLDVAKACENAGADALSAINTLGPGMLIDIESRKPILSNKTGGISGPAIRPIAVKCVYQLYEEVKLPIIGMGGIVDGKDAIEMMMAGARLVGIGSGVYYRGMGVFSKVCKEMEIWLKEHNYRSVKDIIGAAHG